MIWSKPWDARLEIWISRRDCSPIGSRGLGIAWVKGRRRSPRPPARMTAYIEACEGATQCTRLYSPTARRTRRAGVATLQLRPGPAQARGAAGSAGRHAASAHSPVDPGTGAAAARGGRVLEAPDLWLGIRQSVELCELRSLPGTPSHGALRVL